MITGASGGFIEAAGEHASAARRSLRGCSGLRLPSSAADSGCLLPGRHLRGAARRLRFTWVGLGGGWSFLVSGRSLHHRYRREKLTFVAALPVAVLIVAAIELLGLSGAAAWILAISISIALGAIGFRDDFRSRDRSGHLGLESTSSRTRIPTAT